MREVEQLSIMKQIYYQLLERLYVHQFRMKLTAVMNRTRDKKYDNFLKMIESLSTVIEMSLLSGNAKRSLHYCVMLDSEINHLEESVKEDFHKYIEGKLLQ